MIYDKKTDTVYMEENADVPCMAEIVERNDGSITIRIPRAECSSYITLYKDKSWSYDERSGSLLLYAETNDFGPVYESPLRQLEEPDFMLEERERQEMLIEGFQTPSDDDGSFYLFDDDLSSSPMIEDMESEAENHLHVY